ncbi:MAG: hypothetical protein ACTSVV_04365 [Promethearchaeota archaeon]
MNINLTRKVKIEKYQIIMEIGRQENREDLIAILKLAEELGRSLEPKDICDNLLIGKPETLGETILNRCKDLDLLDEKCNLTENGKEALENSKVFLKESGCYYLYITRDQLYPKKLLDIKPIPLESQEMKAHHYINEDSMTNKNDIIDIPDDILNLKGNKFQLKSKGKIIIYNIERSGKYFGIDNEFSLNLFLTIKDIFNEPVLNIRLEGFVNENVDPPYEFDFLKIWLSLLGIRRDDWDIRKKALRINFSELIKDNEKFNFEKEELLIENPEIPNLGQFETTSLRNIPIIPKSNQDAQKWAEWYLIHEINDYIFEDQYEKIQDTVLSLSALDGFQIQLPSREELCKSILAERDKMTDPKKFWYIQTPLDLNEISFD